MGLRYQATDGPANEQGMRDLLAPRGKSRSIGDETGRTVASGISVFTSQFGSVRYVFSENGEALSVLQVMKRGDGLAVATNVFTESAARRRGLARQLLEKARSDFARLRLSETMSPDGAAWANSVESGVRRADVTMTEEFKRWFSNSKVVDAKGRPLVVFHGTKGDLCELRPSRGGEYGSGIYLTADPGAAWMYAERATGEGGQNILPVYITIKNPYIASDRNAARALGVKKLQAMGHDGIIANGSTGERQYIIFRPEQIKSAIGNSGRFDANSPSLTDHSGNHEEDESTPLERQTMCGSPGG